MARYGSLLLLAPLAALIGASACGAPPPDVVETPMTSSLNASVASAVSRHDVPASFLFAAGHLETRWRLPEVHDGEGAAEHSAPLYTRLGVRADQLPMLRAHAGERGDQVTIEDDVAIDAFAAALHAARNAQHIARSAPLVEWLPALSAIGAPDDPEAGEAWALELLRVCARGFEDVSDTGEVIALPGDDVSAEDVEALAETMGALPDGVIANNVAGTDSIYVDRWLAARYDHWNVGRGGTAIDRIIIHTTEGSYDGAISWFRSANNPYNTSAHYVIRDSDGHITQMVREKDTAYHIGGYNPRSIGIEHEGWAGQGGFSDAMYRESAKLVRDICLRRNIPMDRTHIIGHVEVPGASHWDPGPHWDWSKYMGYVRNGTGGGTQPPATSTTRVNADVNGDGRADLVSVHSNGKGYVYRGTTSGTFQAGVASFAGTFGNALFDGTGHLPLGVVDVNGDRRADLVTAHDNGRVYTYLGTSTGAFDARVDSFNGTFNLGTRDGVGHLPAGVADVTGDGRADLVTVHTNGNAYVYPGKSSGGFGTGVASFAGTMATSMIGETGHWPIGVADVDGDGRADLVTAHTNGNAYVYPGKTTGGFGAAVATFAGTLNTSMTDGTGHEFAALADVTGDHRADLVTVRSGTAHVYPGKSDRHFGADASSFDGTLRSSLFDGTGHEIVGALDVNGDGRADLVTSHSNGNGYVYLGRTNGTFGDRKTLFSGTMNSAAHDGTGHSFVSEPWWRRAGCDATEGCKP